VTQDETIELARQAGIVVTGDAVLKLCQLVAEKEREACAKEADKRLHDYTMLTSNPPQSGAAWSIASAIRARGQA
jgi:hypothetical protein